jgi:hypothetical protein
VWRVSAEDLIAPELTRTELRQAARREQRL